MRYVIDLAYLLAAVVVSPVVVCRMIRQNRYRTGWAQRFGKITRKKPDKKSIWIHAVSVGEVNATRTIITELEKTFPDFEIVVTTTTDTGFARANTLFAEEHTVTYFPFDLSCIMRKAFRRIDPAICLLMELEVWPNLLNIANKIHVPVVVVNGRITEKSLRGYKRIAPVAKRIFQKVTLVLAQTPEYADRFIEIGTPPEKLIVTGSLKYDTAQITNKVEGADRLKARLNLGDQPLWVAGGTGPGEEKIILDVYKTLVEQDELRNLRLAVVPRKPERFDEVGQLIQQHGFGLTRYSQIKTATPDQPEKSQIVTQQSTIENRQSKIPFVVLGDTMGDLRKFYSIATIVFVGRSLVPMGGSDMIEAAALGKCTIFGPHTFNFQQTADALLAGNAAILVKDQQQLLATMQKCLSDPQYRQNIAQNGQEIIRKNQGATKKTIEQAEKLLTSAL